MRQERCIPPSAGVCLPQHSGAAGKPEATGPRTPAEWHRAMRSAQRLKRVFGIEIETCAACLGKVRVIASIEDPAVIGKILGHRESRAMPGGLTAAGAGPAPGRARREQIGLRWLAQTLRVPGLAARSTCCHALGTISPWHPFPGWARRSRKFSDVSMTSGLQVPSLEDFHLPPTG